MQPTVVWRAVVHEDPVQLTLLLMPQRMARAVVTGVLAGPAVQHVRDRGAGVGLAVVDQCLVATDEERRIDKDGDPHGVPRKEEAPGFGHRRMVAGLLAGAGSLGRWYFKACRFMARRFTGKAVVLGEEAPQVHQCGAMVERAVLCSILIAFQLSMYVYRLFAFP
jgi:hypothetical protein